MWGVLYVSKAMIDTGDSGSTGTLSKSIQPPGPGNSYVDSDLPEVFYDESLVSCVLTFLM